MNVAPRALTMLGAGVVLLMAATLAADVMIGSGEIEVVNSALSAASGAIRAYAPTTGTALYGDASGGAGLFADSENSYGVWGSSNESWGGYFTSAGGYGIRVDSSGSEHYDHGAYVTSDGGYGVYAQSSNNQGVRGEAGDVTGVSQPLGRVGAVGLGQNRGVHGASLGGLGVYGNSASNYGGYFYSGSYRSLYASSASGYYAGYFTNRGGSAQPGIYVNGTMTVTGSKSGYVVDLARNDGPDPLERGDVVVITGVADAVLGEIPVPTVRLADGLERTGVMGVVDQMFATPEDIRGIPENMRDAWQELRASLMEDDEPGEEPALHRKDIVPESVRKSRPLLEPEAPGRFVSPAEAEFLARASGEEPGIAPGAYVGVVTLGAFKAIRVDAAYGSILPGDLLVSSPTPGHAMRASNARVGTVIGKALGALEAGRGTVPVLITLH